METKVCSKCKEEKEVTEFCFRNKIKKQLYGYCKSCKLKDDLLYYSKNKDKYKNKNKVLKERNKNWVKKYKSNLQCEKCGEDESVCLDFHHLDPKEKEFTISDLKWSTYSIKTLKAEIKKCIVVCANCHRKIHAGLIV